MAQERRRLAIQFFEDLEETAPRFQLSASIGESTSSVAQKIRKALGISIEDQFQWNDQYLAFREWRSAVERLGVLVFQVSKIESNEMRGFSIFEEILPIIAINRGGRESPRARCFSLMHELTHLLLRESGVCDFEEESNLSARESQIEVFCNQVAAEILVPLVVLVSQPELAGIPARPREWTDTTIVTLANRFGVSREVIVRTLHTLGYASRAFYQRKREEYFQLYRELRLEKKDGFEDQARKPLSVFGSSFTRLVLDTYHDGRITLSEAVGHLSTKVKYIPEIEHNLGMA